MGRFNGAFFRIQNFENCQGKGPLNRMDFLVERQ